MPAAPRSGAPRDPRLRGPHTNAHNWSHEPSGPGRGRASHRPDDIAEAVLQVASPRRSGKSTGNVLNVDGGVSAAYPR